MSTVETRDRPEIRAVATAATALILVCRKCSKRVDGGFGPDGDERLAKLLRRAHGGKGKATRARTTVVEVGCLGLCPKRAVVVLRGDRPADWLVVPAGADIAEIGARLGLDPRSPEPKEP